MSDFHFLRRFWLAFILMAVIMLIVSTPVKAFEWLDLWMRTDQQAVGKLSEGQADQAAQLFVDSAWRGVALYQAGDYDGAAEAFAQSQDITAGYNLGNAFAKAGKLEQAAFAYREVLRKSPEHTDAKANLALIEELLQQQLDQSNSDDVQDEQEGQESLQSENEDSQPEPEANEHSEDDGENADNSETNETQQSAQNDRGDNSTSNQQEVDGNDNEMMPSDQIQQASDMDATREDVRGQGDLQDQLVENQMIEEQQTEEEGQIQSVENIDDEVVLSSDQTQQTDDMESAREDVSAQVQQQDQQLDDQMSAEQEAEEKDQAQSDEDELDTARQGVGEERQQQDQAMETQMAIEQLSEEMDESLFVDRMYAETELAPDQWLRLIPDDPSGLLRRKFMLEHLRRQQNSQ